MAEFKLGRIRFVWKGEWNTGTVYYKDDVVRLGGQTYICTVGHTASAAFQTDLEASPTRWNLMADGTEWRGDWATNTFYKRRDLVKYGGLIYICEASHTSAATTILGLEADQNKWDLFAEGFQYVADWAPSQRYRVNDVIKYGGGLYICVVTHTSSASFASDTANWISFVEGIQFEDEWSSSELYQPGDVVIYGGNQYISKTTHSNSVPVTGTANWDLFQSGLKFIAEWNSATFYRIGSVVTLGGYTYLAIADSPSVSINVTATNAGNNYVTVSATAGLQAGMSIRFAGTSFGDLNAGATYYIRTIVNSTNITITATPGGTTITPNTASGTMTATVSAQPPNASYWQRLTSGIAWRGEWQDDVEYLLGDAVQYAANTYICIRAHRSEQDDGSTIAQEGGGGANSRPDQDTTGTYWNLLSVGSETSVLTTKGDLVYFGGAGPTRLPIGREGQLLVAGSEFPEWVSLGEVDFVYFVSTQGEDRPAPIFGKTIDKPWRTIRYACEQVEKGPRNPNAQRLLEMNRAFIQREVTEWIKYQIANNISPFTSSFTYNETKCERDTGFIIDALIYDIAHGGNVKTRGAANAFVNALIDSPGAYPKLATEKEEDIAAWTYMLELVENVLDQEAPLVNYQNTVGSDSSLARAEQFFDANLVAENVMGDITSLVAIITQALEDEDDTNIPPRRSPNNFIQVLPGDYYEVLPIIVPEETALQGNETRSVNALPQIATTDITDSRYSIGALGKLEEIVGDIILGDAVSSSSGNTESQDIAFPYAVGADVPVVKKLVRAMQYGIENRLGTRHLISSANPTNYNTSYLIGYGNARKLIDNNKKFLQEEIRAYLIATYPNLKYSKTKCIRDVGYVIDAIIYDLTYGGNAQSIQAGLAYWEGVGSTRQIDSTELTATLDAYAVLSSRMQAVAQNTLIALPFQSGIRQYRDTAGSAAAATLIANNLTAINDIIENGPGAVGVTTTLSDPATAWVDSALTSAYSSLNSVVSTIQVDVIDYINTNFGSFTYNSAKCRRDTGIIIDGAYYDIALGTNYNSVINGRSYRRAYASEVISGQLEQTVGALIFAQDLAAESLESNATAVARNNTYFNEVIDILENGLGAANALSWSDPGVDVNKRYAREQLQTNRTYIRTELISWINSNFPSLSYNSTTCSRDIGYIVDAFSYDIQYGGNTATRVAAESYFENAVSTLPVAQRAPTAAAITQLGVICSQIVQETYAGQDVSGTAATATEGNRLIVLAALINEVIAANDISLLDAAELPDITWANDGIEAAVAQLASDKVSIVNATLQFITDTYSNFKYNHAKCSRDVGIILKAVGYDFMFDSNFQTTVAARSYLRATASEVFSLGQKTITRNALDFVKSQAILNVNDNATVISRIEALMLLLDDIIYTGSNEGDNCAQGSLSRDYAILQLERNRDYIVAEIDAWIDSNYSDTVTNTTASTNVITISDTSWLQVNQALVFTGTTFGGILLDTIYYVQKILTSTTFTISESRYAADAQRLTLSTASGSMKVKINYNSDLCLRDVNRYIDALKYDLKFTGNYKSLFAARYYANSVLGNLEEDMFYCRNGTGIINFTFKGLTGDLLAENGFGTSRVSAGAYVSLDPGWGPDDYRTWIIDRSPYARAIAAFGYACIGQKIDGDLHNGGNDSIVSNDFTQIVSDGIGTWVNADGKAELVSIFTYYNHIGYLSTGGGKIRALNGNNSYGDFGAVAEGVDPTEVPNTAIVDNKLQFEADVRLVYTDGNQLVTFGYENAGIDYTSVIWNITGEGVSAEVVQDEFRDDGVYTVRLLDFGNDSAGQQGGEGFLSISSIAQAGTLNSITLALTDAQLDTAYPTMKIVITGGTGAGQFGIVPAGGYDSGTKILQVVKESTGLAGWDSFIPGAVIVAPDASSTYTIEPFVEFTEPGFSSTAIVMPGTEDSTLGDSTLGGWTDVKFGYTGDVFGSVVGDYSGRGVTSVANFNVIRNGYKYTVTINAAGLGYTRLETITIPGTSLGGTSPINDLVLTITAVSTTGQILNVDQSGYSFGGRFVAVKAGSDNAAYSNDGENWTATAMPIKGDSMYLAHGQLEDGSTVNAVTRFVAVAKGANQSAYSDDGISWSATNMPFRADWTGIAFGNNRFVAVSDNNTSTPVSFDGQFWDFSGTISAGGFTDITYGRGLFAAVRKNSNVVATSPDGVTWTNRTLPSTQEWTSIAFGDNAFVVVANDSNTGAVSGDGVTWRTMTIGSADGSSVGGYQRVRYAQGLFMATAYQEGVSRYQFVAVSEDGTHWQIKGVNDNNDTDSSINSGFFAVGFGTPNRTGKWIVLEKDGSDVGAVIRTGARTRARALLDGSRIALIKILEPGSGYYDTVPTMTINDPNNIYEAQHIVKVGSGVLGPPTFLNRGNLYPVANAFVDFGDGIADFDQSGRFVAVRRITQRPLPGSNVVFSHLPDRTFKLVNVLTFRGSNDGAYTASFQLSPPLEDFESPPEGTLLTTRIKYSQVRMTGHDFLQIGTGNFEETNYPGLPLQPEIQANETVEGGGGRTFFTSTDQDGNFRVGELFSVEQSTGNATLDADAFNIAGLQELSLGNVTLGGGSATITEFSSDTFFTANSDNIVPTQRAIRAYIDGQISGGQANLNVNSVTAGSVVISGAQITTTTQVTIKMNATFEFRGGITGVPLAFNFFLA